MDIIYIHSKTVALKVPLEVYLVKKKRPERVILKFRHGFGWMEVSTLGPRKIMSDNLYCRV